MALVAASPLALPGTRTLVRPRHLAAVLGPVLALSVCSAGVAAVALPAMRAVDPPASGGPVQVRLVGDISTAGLPAAAAVSTLTVRNTGTAPLVWSARPAVTGARATGVVVEAWVPTGSGCDRPTRLLDAQHWSDSALPPGATTPVCVRVRTTTGAAGVVAPRLTVTARAA